MGATAKEIRARSEFNPKTGVYTYRAYVGRDADGKMIRKTLKGTSINDIINQVNEIEANKESLLKKKDTFGTLAEELIEIKRSKNLSPLSIGCYNECLERIKRVSPWFIELTLDEIDRKAADKLIAELSGYGLAPKTIQTTLAIVRSTLRYNGYTVPPLELPKDEFDEEDFDEQDTPDKPWVDSLLKAAEGTDLWLPIFITAYGPLRRGEVCAITLDDVTKRKDKDGAEKTFIRISKSCKLDEERGEYIIGTVKTKSSVRTITYPAWLYDRIMEQGYIVNVNPDCFYGRYISLIKKAGLERHRFHALRHFFASYYLGLNKPLTWVAYRGGWTPNSPVLLRIYNHLLDSIRLAQDADFLTNLDPDA